MGDGSTLRWDNAEAEFRSSNGVQRLMRVIKQLCSAPRFARSRRSARRHHSCRVRAPHPRHAACRRRVASSQRRLQPRVRPPRAQRCSARAAACSA